MYGTLYSTCYGEVGNNRSLLSVKIVPCFGATITKFERKMYWSINGEILKDEASGEKEIFIASNAQWLLEVDRYKNFYVYVKECTGTLHLPWGDEVNKIFNQRVQEAQMEYKRRKRVEKRLYLYDAQKDKLSLYTDGAYYFSESNWYRLNRLFITYHAIDKKYPIPKESCFILGQVRRTIGTKDGKLKDFIGPVAKFEFDYEVDLDRIEVDGRDLGGKLLQMLQFLIQKGNPSDINVRRIKKKLRCNVPTFMEKLKKALEEGNVGEIRHLYDVVYEP